LAPRIAPIDANELQGDPHLAIDRFTGQVIDKQIEVVNE